MNEPLTALHDALAAATFRDLPDLDYEDRDWEAYSKGDKDKTVKKSRKHRDYDIEVYEIDEDVEFTHIIEMEDEYGQEVDVYLVAESDEDAELQKELLETAAWQRKEGKNPEGGLNQKGVDSYRREHPGSTLKTAVTTKPSKLKPGSKAANRRKSFCARMSGMKKRLTSAKTAHDPDSRINKSLRKWNC